MYDAKIQNGLTDDDREFVAYIHTTYGKYIASVVECVLKGSVKGISFLEVDIVKSIREESKARGLVGDKYKGLWQ